MIDYAFCLTVYCLFATLFLFGIKRSEDCSCEGFFSTINSLRGLFAVEIIIGHCVRYTSTPLTPFGNFMLISVGYFYFVSGYGLSRSYHTKPGYLDGFVKHRILWLIMTALYALVLTTLVAYICPVATDYRNIPLSIPVFLRALLVRTNWYMRELLVLYVLFLTVFRYIKKQRLSVLCALILIMCAVLYALEYRFAPGYTRCWFASLICFPMGIYSYENFDRISAFLASMRGKILSGVIILAGLVFSLIDYSGRFGITFMSSEMISALFNNVLCAGFILVLWCIISYFRPSNAVLRFLTGISTEIYLFQFVFIAIAEKLEFSYPVKIVFVLLADIIFSSFAHILFAKLLSLVRK